MVKLLIFKPSHLLHNRVKHILKIEMFISRNNRLIILEITVSILCEVEVETMAIIEDIITFTIII